MKKWIALCALVAGAMGCGDDTQPSADAAMPDAPAIDAPPIDAPMMDAFGSNCATLTLPQTAVMQMRVAQAPPVPAGGTLVAGTYTVTADVFYTGPGGATGPTGTTVKARGTNSGSPGGP